MRSLLFALAFFVAGPSAAQIATLPPIDEAATDPSFVLFRARLLEAVAMRDTTHIVDQLAPDVFLSFGGSVGINDFREYWLGDKDSVRELWAELARTLPFGSTYGAGLPNDVSGVEAHAIAPYWFGAWPDSLAEGVFDHLVVVGENVNVRMTASAEAPVIAQLSHAVMPTTWNGESAWAPVTLASGKAGFVAKRYARSPIDYRMGFEKVEGRWQIIFFVAGD